jgi:hypothetical protein
LKEAVSGQKEINNFSGIVTPDVVAKKALADAKKGKDISVYGWYTKAAHLAAKWLPQRVIMKIWLKQQRLH